MLELRPSCEHCSKALAADSDEAMICTFECTFCKTCVEKILLNVCPNCGGGFEKRPVRPKRHYKKYPPSSTPVIKPINKSKFKDLLNEFQNINPKDR